MRSLLLALSFLLVSCTGCHPWSTAVPTRRINAQMEAAVKITTSCRVPNEDADIIQEMLGVDVHDYKPAGYGSGVVVSADRILTARHVITCDDGSDSKVTVNTGDGTERQAEVEVLLPGVDVTRLKLVNAGEEIKDFTPVKIGERPKFGDKLCMTSAVPRWGYHCGTMQPDNGEGMFQWDFFTEFGNSGSAVYHDGKLVGLLDALNFCQGHFQCVGHITPLQDYPWLIP